MEVRNTSPAFLMLLSVVLSFSACTPAVEPQAEATAMPAEPEQRKPVFRSAKTISSICEVDDYMITFPGFKENPGNSMREMPPPFAMMMSVGADRPMVETDNSRVAPGYTLIEPFTEKDSFIINNRGSYHMIIDHWSRYVKI